MTNNTYTTSLDDDDLLGATITISPTAPGTYWGTAGSSFTNGATITSGLSGLRWQDLSIELSNTISIGDSGKELTVKGEAQFEHDITIKGVKLMETLEKIEHRLNILRVDPELEERWAELKELGDRYRAIESECLEKELMIKILKG